MHVALVIPENANIGNAADVVCNDRHRLTIHRLMPGDVSVEKKDNNSLLLKETEVCLFEQKILIVIYHLYVPDAFRRFMMDGAEIDLCYLDPYDLCRRCVDGCLGWTRISPAILAAAARFGGINAILRLFNPCNLQELDRIEGQLFDL